MTETQYLVLVAVVWIAPHTPKGLSLFNGLAMIVLAAALGLGVFK